MRFQPTGPRSAVLIAAVSALLAAGCSIPAAFGDETRRIETDVVAADGVEVLVVETSNGSVDVVGRHTDQIEIRSELTETDHGLARTTLERHDDRLIVAGDCDSRWWQSCRVAFEITVPIDLDVEIATGSGAVALSGVRGNVDLASDNGRIEAVELSGPDVAARSGNGAIDLAFHRPPTRIEARTGNGAIRIRTVHAVYDVEADSGNGSVVVEVDTSPESVHAMRLHSGNGSIRVEEV